jgi:hypothetical protein
MAMMAVPTAVCGLRSAIFDRDLTIGAAKNDDEKS